MESDSVSPVVCFVGGDRAARLAALTQRVGSTPPEGVLWWVAPDRFAVADAQQRIATQMGPRLGWRVATLAQLAVAVCRWSGAPARLLSASQQRGLAAEALAAVRGRLEVLAAAPAGPGMVDYVAAQLGHLAHGRPLGDLPPLEQRRWADLRRVAKEYGRLLKRGGLVDDAGRLRLAAQVLASPPTGGALALPAVLAIDSDAPFSPLEMRWLGAAVDRAPQVLLSVGDDAQSADSQSRQAWEKLFEGGRRGAQWIDVAPLPGRPVSGYVQRWLFAGEAAPPAPPAEASDRYRVIASPSAERQWSDIAAGVKQRLTSGRVAADEVVVAAPNLREAHRRAAAALDDAGVPWAVDRRPRLGEAAVIGSLQRLLTLARDDWPLAGLVDVLRDPLLGAFDRGVPEALLQEAGQSGFAGGRAACEWVVLRVQTPTGRERLLRRLASIIEASSGDAPLDPDADKRLPHAAPAAAALLEGLSQRLTPCLAAASPLVWLARIEALLAGLGVSLESDPLDRLAVPALGELLADAENLAAWLGRPAPEWTLAELLDRLADWSGRMAIAAPRDEAGRVRLVSYETAARMAPRLLVAAGVGESAFSHAGGPEAARRQMLALASAATQEAWFVYESRNARGDALAPSPLLAELEQLLAPAQLRMSVDADAAPSSRTAARDYAVRAAAQGDAAPLAAMLGVGGLAETAAALCDALEVGHDRATGDAFGPFEGIAASPATHALLAARFGPTKCWSASALETYAACPFKFFMQSVVGAEPLEAPLLEIDHARRGKLLHDALVRVHADPSLSDTGVAAAFQEAVHAELAKLAVSSADAALAEIEARQAAAWSAGYADQIKAYHKLSKDLTQPLRPAHFELRFGPARGAPPAGEDPLTRDDPFVLRAGDEDLLLAGRIDRIDLGKLGEQTVFAVIDYKSSKSMRLLRGEVEAGRQAQLVLYTLAAQDHLLAADAAAPLLAGYWLVQKGGFKHASSSRSAEPPISLTPFRVVDGALEADAEWPAIEAAVRAAVAASVAALRRGEFPMFNPDENCTSTCDFKTVCRVAQTRALGKTPSAPGPAGG
ncbi:PD-(D/E)XK nuclease family protein [Pirellulimonas nuda]|uniref:PD-(D/E)XK nuclease family protein n=1 Tax=Pirellulimonas nuda TaxID=2528009 RepID=UPI0011A70F4B|nr:PD-(D/E)XK nuclease family protein [Pirellulimonas nuda]